MFKKFTLITTLFTLTACDISLLPNNQMAYKVSDEEVNNFILKANAFEQCLYPEIKLANNDKAELDKIYKSWSPEVSKMLFWESLNSSFPPDTIYIISKDKDSQEYLWKSHERLNHSKPTEPPYELSPQKCNEFKKYFSATLKKLEENAK